MSIVIQLTGMSGAGKTTIANRVADCLKRKHHYVEVLDGDEYRVALCSDLGFSKKDRHINIMRLGFVSKVLARNDVIAIIAAINPYRQTRNEITKLCNAFTAYIQCDIATLSRRDVKGLYRKALLPDGHHDKLQNFTGISDPYEEPKHADIVINTADETINQSVNKLEKFILNRL